LSSARRGSIQALLWFGFASSLLPACSDDKHAAPAADGGGSGGSLAAGGGGRGGSGGASLAADGGVALGAACAKDSDCGGSFACDREIAQLADVSGSPDGEVDLSLFPGGSCTPIALAALDANGTGKSCDPSMPSGSQGCGVDGVCLPETVNGKQLVGCRVACEPSATESGCARSGYTCDFGVHACIEGCRSDTECRVLFTDTDGDGQPDSAMYDRSSQATCDAKTGRCDHPSGGQAIGASCTRDDDCGSDGACIDDSSSVAGVRFPGGYCSKVGCDVAGRDCEGDGSVCQAVRPLLDESPSNLLCLTRCTVGAESSDLQLGSMGHGEGCRAGYQCHYNGGTGADAGVCVGGNYNAVTTNNLGAGCTVGTDCYSRFGIGRCLTYGLPNNLSSTGICTMLDCNVPGIPDDVCGTGNECVGSSGDQAFCAHDCSKANDCPGGFACYDDDGDSGTSKICYPICGADDDCRSGEKCKLFTGEMYGQCGLQ
jgi:hypothetical protein